MRFLTRPLRHFSIKKDKNPISFEELIFFETECKNCSPDCIKKIIPKNKNILKLENNKPKHNYSKQKYPNKNVKKIIDDFLYNKKNKKY